MPFVEQGTPTTFDNPAWNFDDPSVPFDEVPITTRTLNGGHSRSAALGAGWLRTIGARLGNRPFTQKTSFQKAEPQRRREGPLRARGRMVRDH